ncbi:MAG: peptide-binding protein [Bdellovibrionaceae bacterium]|nr:peptide-binding protein [Pseudobdellovibrionaceae bacterium]MBX3032662.1 peptide-binding protein [Pseudobdellovibrionaceae bacterium]
MKLHALLTLLLTAAFALPATAVEPNAKAPKGGTFNYNLGGEPPTVHPIMSTDLYSRKVREWMGDTLAARDANTYDWKPRLAEKWEISKDNKVFTFHLRQGLKFHDGKDVTAEDVKFSFDAIFEPKYEAAHMRPYYEGIAKAEVVDPHTIRFTAKDTYFKNFDVVAELEVIPKHIYSDIAKSKKMTREYVGVGPYKLEKFDRGQMIVLKRFEPWAETVGASWPGAYNFDRVIMRFYKDENVELERLKKGDLDYGELSAEAYVKKAVGEPWGKSVLKKKVENDGPVSYGFVGWNFRRDLFQDRNTRIALAHLLNRDEIIKKFAYGLSEAARGPVFNRSEYASPKVKAFNFDPKAARELLAKAGWKDDDKNGVLEKNINGKNVEFRFALIYPNKDTEKYWTLYREDLKKAGIEMDLRYLEWNSFLKLIDEGNFDAAALAWGGGDLFWDPKQIWHSSSAVPGGSNFIAYKNPEVDKLIDESRQIMDRNKRRDSLRKVYELIAADAPYAFLTNPKFAYYGLSSRVQQPGETFKYRVGYEYWWVKP